MTSDPWLLPLDKHMARVHIQPSQDTAQQGCLPTATGSQQTVARETDQQEPSGTYILVTVCYAEYPPPPITYVTKEGVPSPRIPWNLPIYKTQIGPRWKRYWEDSTITEKREGKCCGRAVNATEWEENDSVIRICAPKKWVAGSWIQAQNTGGRCINRALINKGERMKGQIEGEWVEVA